MCQDLTWASSIAVLLALGAGCDDKDTEVEAPDTAAEAAEESTWYLDADGDGYGDASAPLDAAEQPADHVADSTDCDDTDEAIFPGADELCDDIDSDCDGEVDEEAVDVSTFYVDADADGYGDPRNTTAACDQPSGAVTDSTDCDDTDGAIFPGADELCDDIDSDCDGEVDEEAVDVSTFYVDADDDGHGDPGAATEEGCDQPSGYESSADDCDDTDPTVNPSAVDDADGVDQDCDGQDGYTFNEDFESYSVGDYIADSSYIFSTWTTGGEGGTEDALVTDAEVYSTGARSVMLSESGGDDLVVNLGPADGSWLLEWYMFVDTGAYFNLQGLAAPYGDWQKEIHIDEDGNLYEDNYATGDTVSVGQWILVEYYVDVDAGTQEVYVDSALLISGGFSGAVLGGVDFYPTLAPDATTEDDIVFYIDDIIFSQLSR